MTTIKDVEVHAQAEITPILKQLQLLPDGYVCSIRLRSKARKKKQSASLDKNWHPETDSIEITFERAPERATPVNNVTAKLPEFAAPPAAFASPEVDLVKALDRAESRPGYKFVSLKWFRDTALKSEGFAWAVDDATRKSVLGDAIDNKLVLTSSVPNPGSPYPTTAIRLNRLMPQVRRIFGVEDGDVGMSNFKPLPIRGESLSSTVLRDRR